MLSLEKLEQRVTEDQTENVVATVVAQSSQLRHVLVQDARQVRYAVTRETYVGDWSTLKLGNVIELVVTCEPMPAVLTARPAEQPGTQSS